MLQKEIVLTSTQNAQVKQWKQLLKKRDERELRHEYIVEGEHMVQEALNEGVVNALLLQEDKKEHFSALLSMSQRQDICVYLLSSNIISAICDTKTPQGILAVCKMYDNVSQFTTKYVVALENVQDPGNVGTIIRTLDAIGNASLLLTKRSVDVYSPKTLRASMGGVFRVPIVVCEEMTSTLDDMTAQGYDVYAGSLHGLPFYDRPYNGTKNICLLIGNEGAGLSDEILRHATHQVKLPMYGKAESLNAGVACAVMLYDFVRIDNQ